MCGTRIRTEHQIRRSKYRHGLFERCLANQIHDIRTAALGYLLSVVFFQCRVATRGHAIGFLYVDGHVRAYHGKRSIPKTRVARMRIAMPATTDYWVNDAEGEPLFVVTTEANKGLVKMLPEVLEEVRSLVGDRRVTVIFDRGGWSPKLFKKIIGEDFDIITYRKGRSRRVSKSRFSPHQATSGSHLQGQQ